MEARNKFILIAILFIILILGILMRFEYASYFNYEDANGDYIPSNPDGLYWINYDIEHQELWADNNIMDNKYFSFITFLAVIFIGLIIINYNTKNIELSTIFVFFMLFSKFLYTRSAIGFYDHDYLGLIVFLILVLFYYIDGHFLILSPLVVYLLTFVWDGIIPVAYLLIIIIFIEYVVRRFKWKIQIFKYLLYVILTWIVINKRINQDLLISEAMFKLPHLIIMMPFLIIGLWLAISQKEWFWQAIIIFSTIILLHSGRMSIISFPLIFIANCVLMKRSRYKVLLITVLIFIFILTQFGGYLHLDRFGTSTADEGLYYLAENTSKGANILAWWDFGYYIEYLSESNAIFSGTGRNPHLKELSIFYCNGTIPSYNFDYFIHFSYMPELIPAILHYNGNSCNTTGYMDQLSSDDRFELEYSNEDIEIYRFKGIGES